jgi:hypothetical protein
MALSAFPLPLPLRGAGDLPDCDSIPTFRRRLDKNPVQFFPVKGDIGDYGSFIILTLSAGPQLTLICPSTTPYLISSLSILET